MELSSLASLDSQVILVASVVMAAAVLGWRLIRALNRRTSLAKGAESLALALQHAAALKLAAQSERPAAEGEREPAPAAPAAPDAVLAALDVALVPTPAPVALAVELVSVPSPAGPDEFVAPVYDVWAPRRQKAMW